MHSSLISRNPLAVLWLPFILAVVMFIAGELSGSAQSLVAVRTGDSIAVQVLHAARLDDADAEVSRSVGLMEGAAGDESPLQASGEQAEVSRSIGLMTGAPGDGGEPFTGGILHESLRSIGFA